MTITGVPGGTASGTTSRQWLDVFAGTGANWFPGDLVVVIVGCDNAGASGASPISGVTDSRGHAYTQHHNYKKSNSTTPNGAEAVGVFTAVVGPAGMASGDVVTAHFGGINVASSTVVVWQFRSTLGAFNFDPPDKVDEGFGTSAGWSGFQVAAGHCVVGIAVGEYTGTPGGDTDTQYGSWSSKHYRTANTGTATSSIATSTQWKVPNTTGTQQFTSTMGSSSVDWVSIGFVFRDVTPPVINTGAASAPLGALVAQAPYGTEVIAGTVGMTAAAPLGGLLARVEGPQVTADAGKGCPFSRADQPKGDWAAGWRLVVDAYYYAIVDGAEPAMQWVDLTEPTFRIDVGDGMTEGEPRVTVSEVVAEFVDPTGTWFDVTDPIIYPQPGTPLRVAVVDPAGLIHPLLTGEIERIEDVHDGDHPRTVTVRGFGRMINLVIDVPAVELPQGMASERMTSLAAAAGYHNPITYPPGDAQLIGEFKTNMVMRDEMDRTAQSVGWFMDATRSGHIRVRTWPHQPEGEPVAVTDCHGTDALVSHAITYANDESHLLNYVITSNSQVANVVAENLESIAQYGRRGRAFGFPLMGLAWHSEQTAIVWAQRIADRFAWITRQVESVEIDTHVDDRWLPVLADLDTGRPVIVTRTGLTPSVIDGVVVGWRHALTPGRWESSVFVSTTTDTFPYVPPPPPEPPVGQVVGTAQILIQNTPPNHYLTVDEVPANSWDGVVWPADGSQIDVTVNGEQIGRYKSSASFAGQAWLYHTLAGTQIRVACINADAADNTAVLTPLAGTTNVTVSWNNVRPPAERIRGRTVT